MHDNSKNLFIRLDFFGQSYDLKADDNEIDVQELIDYVHDKVKEQDILNGGLAPHKKMILAVLNMGRDYLLAKKKLKEMEERYITKAEMLVAKIDSVIELK
ncbi:cell division protein ZapA [Dissulfurimicrobium hydrothermale]|nr:cell division protein ZapA [Dissulfurimicrobium hydrothermale]